MFLFVDCIILLIMFISSLKNHFKGNFIKMNLGLGYRVLVKDFLFSDINLKVYLGQIFVWRFLFVCLFLSRKEI